MYIYIYIYACVHVYTHSLAQVANLACDDPAAFSMNSACDLEIQGFVDAMGLRDAWSDGVPLHARMVSTFIVAHGLSPAAMHTLSLLPEPLRSLVVRSFHPKGDRSTWSACFDAHANAIQRAWIHLAVDAHHPRDCKPCGGAESDGRCRKVQSAQAGASSRNI